nr:reverse transcriptase [Tanacetum cinerariifolium]
DDFDNYIDGDDETYQDYVGDMGGVTDSPQITLNALYGLNFYQTMRVRGTVGKQVVHQLVDCGSTHNFFRHSHSQEAGMESVGSISAKVEQVLTQFDKVFEVTKDLPPQRSHDHQIPLMPNTLPINVRPYRHPPNQKDAIEVKDKFPILVIEELIDELNGSVVFFKLDLRSRYHQIRMNKDDIFKTAFRTYEGHYKFFVMPFGLIDAPSTLQKEHCDHLAQVLQVMKENTMYLKRTKCYFAVPQVEYLGHTISAQGVSIDPSKIEAIQKLPIPLTLKQLRGFIGLTGYYRSGVWDKVKDSCKNDLDTQNLIKSLEHHSYKGNKYSWTGEILKRKGKVVVGNDLKLKKKLVRHFHDEAIGGHSGAHVTMKKLGSLFYWKGLKKIVKQMIRDCNVCQR